MNKVFKVIWSEARNAYVVVSEIAKNHGSKSCSTKKLLTMLIATGVMTCASVAPVIAANPAPNDTQIAVGKDAKANGGDSVAIGNSAEAKAANGIAIGYKSLSGDRGWGVAIGGNTQAIGTYSVALGQTAKAFEYEGIAIGHTSLSEGSGAVAIGKSTNAKGAASLAFGNDAKALAEASIAFGQGSTSDGNRSIAVGSSSAAHGTNSIAIGNQAITSKDNSVVIGGHTYKGTTGTGVTGVGQQTQVLGNYSAAFGMTAKANFDNATAIGSYANAMAAGSVALGAGSTVKREAGVQGYDPLTGDKSADTSSAWKSTKGAVSVGDVGVTRQIINVAAGSEDTDAVNVAQLKKVAVEAGKHTTLVDGENTKATLVKDDATGTQYKVDVDLSKYAKTEDVAVVYDKNKNSLRSTNATLQTSSKKEEAVDSIALGKDASAVKESVAIGNGASVVEGSNGLGGVALGYKAHAGYKGTSLGSNAISGREGTTLVGANTNSGSLYTTVVGTDSVINSSGVKYLGTVNVQGATATVVGSKNTVDNKNGKVYSGVANNVMGSANTIEGSNGVTIQGTGNKVTDAYKDMNIGVLEAYYIGKGDYSALAKKKSGAVAVIGGANTVSKQTDSTVIGYDNKLTGDKEKGSHDVFMAGSHNKLNNVSDSIVMGNENAITGVSNVISFGHQNEITANNAVAIGNGAGVSVEDGVALGVGSVASTAAGALGYGAAEGETGIAWKATNGAVSVGSSVEGKKITRQITNVAAGTADTDAVNVSQLKKVSDTANAGWNLSTNGVATEATNVKPGDYVDFSGDKNISVSHDGTKVQVELNKNIDVNYVQTNALNSKYNLSVGTMAENGIMPFLVNSTGAFYAANNNFSVDKDGKVIATAGEIGNVVLKNGVLYKNTALRDGELYLGDASGNYSQITTTGAKLGQVTIAADGKISGVAAGEVSSTSTDAINGSQLHAVATEAGKHTTLSNGKNTTVESTVKDGQTDYKVNVAGDLTDITSVANGDSKINLNKDSIIISNGNKYFAITNSGIGMSYIGADYSAKSIMLGENGTTISGGLNVAGSKITGVAAGVEKTDAVNVGQLKDYVAANDTHIKSGNYAVGEVTDSTGNKSQGVSMDIVNKEGKVTGTVTITDVAKASDVGDVNNIASDIKNQDGSHTTVVDAVNNLNQKLDNKVGDLNYVEGGKGNYVTNGENTTTSIGKLDQALKDVAATAAKHTKVEGSSNIIVTNTAKEGEAANYKVELKKDIDVDTVKATTVTTGQTVMNNDGLKVGKDVSVTATAVIAGKTSISDEGVKVGDKTYISDKGLNANDQKITNVADGKVEKGSTDAVNGGQLYNETRVAKDGNFVKKSNTAGENLSALDNQVTANTESIYHMNGRISDLDNRVNKVGAGAAALAALHPLDFDPDAKWDFAAGYGNYRGANAAAVGAYYRPNEDTMFSVGGTFGNGENMVNAGISFKLGSGSSHVSTSRVAMAKEIKELRGELEAMKSAMLDANAGKKIDTSKLQLFPDVPQNHWAYEYVAQLAGNGMIEGYPDGNFAGDRPMTRYEFAAILYRAMTKGAVLSDKILSEFSHELEYFTVDTIAKDKAGNPTIQRVRTVKENKNK